MKKITFLTVLLFLAVSLLQTKSFAQDGSTCATAVQVTTLPFIETGYNTENSGDNYASDPCGTTYMSGNDFVFVYTPSQNIDVSIAITNSNVGCGVFIFKGCPDSPTVVCYDHDTNEDGNPVIQNSSLTADTTYYIVVSTYNAYNLNPSTSFDIAITPVSDYDAMIKYVNKPYTHHNLGQEDVNIQIKNNGLQTLTEIPVAFRINGGTIQRDTCRLTINPDAETFYNFIPQADLSIIGETYLIEMFTDLPNDEFRLNDTVSILVSNKTIVNTFPYEETFESGDGDWTPEWYFVEKPYFSWELGTPNASIINSAASTDNSWVTNLSGDYETGEVSKIISPSFDLSTLVHPILELKYWSETGLFSTVNIQYSIDDGEHWTVLGDVDDGNNWYNNSSANLVGWRENAGAWKTAKHNLDSVVGLDNVLFEVYIITAGAQLDEGFAFDDIKIYEANTKDLGIISCANESSCDLETQNSISISYSNQGVESQTNYDVAYSIDGGQNFTIETISNPINPNDTVNYTFSTLADFSSQGVYNLIVKTVLASDQYTVNDSLEKTIYNYDIVSSIPYSEDFEANDGGWFGYGQYSSWEYGTPNETIINTAASGTKAWATNLTGNHNEEEKSYLVSPCFDLTSVDLPRVSMNIFYNLTSPSYVQLQASTDGGENWTTVDNDSENALYSTGHAWSSSIANWQEVHTTMPAYANSPKVQFRIYFNGGLVNSGFAFDDFTIDNFNDVSNVLSNSFSIFPNPVSNIINITTTNIISDCDIKIVDVLGNISLHKRINNSSSNKYFINVGDLKDGIYFIILTSKNIKSVQKISIIK